MKHIIRLFVLLISFNFFGLAYGQNELVLGPYSFLEDSAKAPDYNTAFLVTDGDTLISWSKKGNKTIATYLNTKNTKTVWADSVEVCTQEGFMLEDFYETCYRFDLNGKWFQFTSKSKERYGYRLRKKDLTHWFNKSYSKGLESENWDYKNGDSRSIRYSSDGITFAERKGKESKQVTVKEGDTTRIHFYRPDSSYTKNDRYENFTYDYLNGEVKVSKTTLKTDSSFSVNRQVEHFTKCAGAKKYTHSAGTVTLPSGIMALVRREDCEKPSAIITYTFLKPRDVGVIPNGVHYSTDSIYYLNTDSVVLKKEVFVFRKDVPRQKITTENNQVTTSKLSKKERKTLGRRIKHAEDIQNLPIRNIPNYKRGVKARSNLTVSLRIEDSVYAWIEGIEKFSDLFYLDGRKNEEVPAFLIFKQDELIEVIGNPSTSRDYKAWDSPIFIEKSAIETKLIFIDETKRARTMQAELVLPFWYTIFYFARE